MENKSTFPVNLPRMTRGINSSGWTSRFLSLCITSLIFLTACTRAGDDNNPEPNPSSPNGTLYVNVVGEFMKLEPSTDSVYWRSPALIYNSSAGNPMTFDSGYFYFGNYMSITCYRASTGAVAWSHQWLAFSDAYTYREPAFKDSLIYFTYPTSVWDHGYLMCMKKRTGALVWKHQYDSGGVFTSFNGIPVISGDKVICMTRNANDQLILKAFNTLTGQLAWANPVSASMQNKLLEKNGRLYSAYANDAVCFDANTGQQLWKTDIKDPVYKYSYNFLANDKLVVVRVLNNYEYQVIQLNLNTGAVISSQHISLLTTYASFAQLIAPLGCSYRDNKLYLAHYYSIDSLDIYSFDASNASQLWTKRFANSLLTGLAPVLTDRYLIFPVNDQYNGPTPEKSNMIVLDLAGNLVKKVPFRSIYTDKMVYEENGVYYYQGQRF